MLNWIPNALTLSRCVFAVLVLFGALQAAGMSAAQAGAGGDEALRYATLAQLWHQFALLAFISGALTDFIDGWAARALKAESRFGIWLDPIADKVLVGFALLAVSMTLKSWLIYVPAALIIARDVFMTWLRTRPEAASVVLPSNLAKVKTAVEMVAIAGLMLPFALAPSTVEAAQGADPLAVGAAVLIVFLLWLAAALSLMTAAQYVRAIRHAA
ncbi:MAG TPA: CDP-alcohol phosphatidyltransferase family protein [Hyphomonas sp.]|nr:CDP-diacylglycerol--glycerol-3-phosphate 3-phosphatidyltransferase [Hyphomonas sp.]HRI99753.1 CDP-alcohol phosphatidyltransferase family protein [Hyphomonas sp.]HRK66032.1 CDP-alcohol phosphatidyltransferase family protein [Hyphomonas sp.]